jgi:dTMP kinase
VFFDVDPETGASRSESADKFETISFLSDVKANYERLITADPDRFRRIDASENKGSVLETTIATIRRSITNP